MARFDAEIAKNKRSISDLVARSRVIVALGEKEDRSLTPEERTEVDNMDAKIEEHEGRISRLEKLNKEDDAPPPADDDDGMRDGRPELERRTHKGKVRRHATEAYRDAYHGYLMHGVQGMHAEHRDMVVGTNSAGGFLLAPVAMADEIIKQVDDQVHIRQLAKVHTVKAAVATGIRQRLTRVSDADWTTEIGGPNAADSAFALGRRDLTPQLLAKLVKASIKLVESGPEAEAIVNEDLAYKFAVSQEKAFMTGDGSGKPLGVFTASANGVPTSQDVTSGTSGSFGADDLIATKYGIKAGYTQDKTCRWMLNRGIVRRIRQMKDSQNQYLWQAGLAADKPDTLLDIPVCMSEYAPNTVSAGSYVAVLGAFRFYAIAQLKDFWVQRLNELYAEASEVGFIGRAYIDGAPVLAEAFARLKCAA